MTISSSSINHIAEKFRTNAENCIPTASANYVQLMNAITTEHEVTTDERFKMAEEILAPHGRAQEAAIALARRELALGA